jgi:hypothetical protein
MCMRLFPFLVPLFRGRPTLGIVLGCALFFMGCAMSSRAQNYPSGPTSLSPAVQPVYKVNKLTREAKRIQPKVKHSAEFQFYDRVQRAAKSKKRTLRKLNKPQYTNPLYFGHKNPPKKREVHKMRFCSECGIRH